MTTPGSDWPSRRCWWLLAALLSGGCTSAPPRVAPSPRSVPLPVCTPYAPASASEIEYLRLFRLGYAAARRGGFCTFCLFGQDFDDPVRVARSQGWHAGQAEGEMVWAAEVEQACADQDRARLLQLYDALGDDAGAAVEQMLADRVPLRR